MIDRHEYFLISEEGTDELYFYMGYYEDGLPCFNMAIADAVHIASFDNAKQIHEKLNTILPCKIMKVCEGKSVIYVK
jgi:hypothetical protein